MEQGVTGAREGTPRHSAACGTKGNLIDIIGLVTFNIDPTWLFLSLIPGGVGFVLIVYGKKRERAIHVLFGALYSVYPFFTESITMLVLVGIGLGVALWWALKSGY